MEKRLCCFIELHYLCSAKDLGSKSVIGMVIVENQIYFHLYAND